VCVTRLGTHTSRPRHTGHDVTTRAASSCRRAGSPCCSFPLTSGRVRTQKAHQKRLHVALVERVVHRPMPSSRVFRAGCRSAGSSVRKSLAMYCLSILSRRSAGKVEDARVDPSVQPLRNSLRVTAHVNAEIPPQHKVLAGAGRGVALDVEAGEEAVLAAS